MRVKCMLCEKIEKIDDHSVLAKKLRNRPIHTFMCDTCSDRIANKTKDRWASGSFALYNHQPEKEDF